MWKFQIWMLCIVIYETFIYECYFIYLMKLSYIWMLFHIATNAISYMKPSWYISCYIKILYMNAIFHIYICYFIYETFIYECYFIYETFIYERYFIYDNFIYEPGAISYMNAVSYICVISYMKHFHFRIFKIWIVPNIILI